MGLLWAPYGTPIGFLDRPTTNDVLRCWSVRPCVVIVAQSFFGGYYRIPIGLLWDSYWFMTMMINDDVVVVAVVVDVVAAVF